MSESRAPVAPRIRRATDADISAVIDILADGFAADPFFGWIYGDDNPTARTREYLDFVCRRVWPRVEADVIDEVAAAVWLPPDRELATADDFADLGALLERQIGSRSADVLSAIGSTAAHVPAQSHAVCVYVGVRPMHRGQGIGAALVAPRLRDYDASATPVYLTSTNSRNVAFYERFGFLELAALPVEPGGMSLRPMWRNVGASK